MAPATITGTIFNDIDADATQDIGERAQAGVRAFLDANDNGTLDGHNTTHSADVPKAIPTGTEPVRVNSTLSTDGGAGTDNIEGVVADTLTATR